MFCPHCGTQIDASRSTCPVCNKNAAILTPLPKKNNSFWYGLLGVVVIAAALFAGMLYIAEERVESPVEGLLTAIRENRITESYYEYTSKEFQDHTTFDDFKTFINVHPELAQTTEFTINNVASNNNTAALEGTLHFADGTAVPAEYQLVKEDDGWKIVAITFATGSQESNSFNKPQQQHLNQHRAPEHASAQKPHSSPPKIWQDLTALEDSDYSISDKYPSQLDDSDFADSEAAPAPAPIPAVEPPKITQMINKVVTTPKAPAPAPEPTPATPPTPDVPATTTQEFGSQEFVDMIQLQLRALKQNNVTKAYSSEFTSKGFRDATALKDFEDYMKKHPVFTQYKDLEFNKISLKDGITTVTVSLVVSDVERYLVEYTFVKDDNQWKIQHILIPTADAATILQGKTGEKGSSMGPLEFSKSVFGSIVDAQGIIKDPELVLKSTIPNIFINLFIKNGVNGTKIDLQLQHVESGSKSSDVSTSIQKDGDTVLSIGYPAPKNGWLKGTYKLTVKSSTGIQHTFLFIIE